MTRTKDIWGKVSQMNLPTGFTLGPINAESMLKDPKHLAFTLSRYKFAAKMMSECKHIVEVGCGEGIGTFMFLSETSAKITAIDFDEAQIDYARKNVAPHTQGRVTFVCQDMISTPYGGEQADGLVVVDAIEHLHPEEEHEFIDHCSRCLEPRGTAVFGTPNRHASDYASERSQQGHINLYDPERLNSTLRKYFPNVFLFSMNDEVVHTGFNKLAHYLMALCVK